MDVSPKELFDFEHLKDEGDRSEELLTAIKNKTVDVDLLYRIYQFIKK